MLDDIRNEVLKYTKEYKDGSEDHYDFWNEHIKYVVEESLKLAELYGADRKIVELGALLHDIALVKKIGEREDHHVNGAKLAKEILERYDCDESIKNRIIDCVNNHGSSKNAKTVEELCICDADILAHFDNIPMLFNSAFNRSKMNLNEVRTWMKACFEKDYEDLSDRTKEVFKERYDTICEVVIGK